MMVVCGRSKRFMRARRELAVPGFARHGFRPRSEAVLARHAGDFSGAKFFRVESTLGPWGEVQKRHFAEGGTFDQIFQNRR